MHIEIPDPLATDIEDVYMEAGYASRTDFIRDATRRRVEELREK